MGIVIGFIPWIVYWILVGNIPFTTAVTIAFAITLLIQIILRTRKQPLHTLDVGNLIVFAILTLAAYLVPDNVLERWLQPLSSLGLFLIALVGLLIGRPFVREYAVESVDAETAKTQGFRAITNAMTWMWVVAFGLMFVSSMIPPIVDGAATILDMDNTLSIICYWVIPYTVLGIAGAVSATFPPWFDRRSAEIGKRTATAPVVTAQPAPPPDLAAGGLIIDAPAESRLDEPFAVTVTGGKAGSTVEVTTSGNDLFGRSWRSRAAFTVPTNGIVDLSMVPPHGIDGQDPDWSAADGTAPIWAMRFDDEGKTPEMFVPPAEPWQLTVDARGIGHIASTDSGTASSPVTGRRTVLRRMGAAGLRFEPADVGELPGMLVLPAGDAPASGWPGVACFGGSEGGFESQLSNAAVLASRGFAAFAAPWISEADAAVNISEVPLERFAAALSVLADHPAVDGGQAVGDGDLPRRRGVCWPRPAAGSVRRCGRWCWSARAAWRGRRSGRPARCPTPPPGPSTGRPVPWVPLASGVLMRQIVRNAWTVGRDIAHQRPTLLRLRPAYENSLVAAGLLARRGDSGSPAAGSGDGAPATAGWLGAGRHQGRRARC